MKLHIELHDDDGKLLEAMAAENYRDARQQAAWLISCAVATWAAYEVVEDRTAKERDDASLP